MTTFRAFRIDREDERIVAGFQTLTLDDLTAGDVVVRVTHSSINYKDALAATGKGAILRQYPLNGGIDMAGIVVESADDRFAPGDRVLATGNGLSETIDGGYSETFRSPGDTLVPVPEALSNVQAMQLGTAGFTAALAVHRME
ncbi:MAG: alcohol dehydrogenase catalytic domain-containing protein, partial [Pseudomonadota bacterium]